MSKKAQQYRQLISKECKVYYLIQFPFCCQLSLTINAPFLTLVFRKEKVVLGSASSQSGIWTYVYPVKCTLKNLQQFRADEPEYREEKSLRHVAMVAKFLDDNKPKRHLKSGFTLFQTSSILFNFFAVRVAVAKTPCCCHPEILLPW